jgi:hypothetical protein
VSVPSDHVKLLQQWIEQMLDFLELVKEMRECQKEYFRTRGLGVLKESKKREKQVDQALLDFENPQV